MCRLVHVFTAAWITPSQYMKFSSIAEMGVAGRWCITKENVLMTVCLSTQHFPRHPNSAKWIIFLHFLYLYWLCRVSITRLYRCCWCCNINQVKEMPHFAEKGELIVHNIIHISGLLLMVDMIPHWISTARCAVLLLFYFCAGTFMYCLQGHQVVTKIR